MINSNNVPTQEELQVQLLALQKEYEAKLPQRLADIDTYWTQLKHNPSQPKVAQQLYRSLHRLAGSGATFGFNELSEQASRIELLIKTWTTDNPTIIHTDFKLADTLITEILKKKPS